MQESGIYFPSTSAPSLLKVGDVLKQTRRFSDKDVLEYSKVTYDSNPMHFDSESAQNAGFKDRLVHGLIVAALAKFKTKCFKDGEVVVDGKAMALLPSLALEQVCSLDDK
ncbi:hypothetical protein FNV43_RR04314 [Rhamnella rubrinervis]|uniref:MaoC-like domain-containing protein n=1 Tax=Rhamnella rubrinervis TaxID=2594499 RepID=A0A8K0HKS8_9ROSA|nr:hypothetical protein FNV43_RR04314 [Rhamnella rubrinervis]